MSDEKKMTWAEARHERRTLKQKLFYIRRSLEGPGLKLNKELLELKKFYEAKPGFTSWSEFPEKWDIGDPHNVKAGTYSFNDIDKINVEKILGKSYDKIIHLDSHKNDDEE